MLCKSQAALYSTRLKKLTIHSGPSLAGHSLGGQLVHRYSILGCPPLTWQQRQALVVEYVVMNPASYLYFTPERAGPPAAVSGFHPLANPDGGSIVDTLLAW